jgi:hypothetical protein
MKIFISKKEKFKSKYAWFEFKMIEFEIRKNSKNNGQRLFKK